MTEVERILEKIGAKVRKPDPALLLRTIVRIPPNRLLWQLVAVARSKLENPETFSKSKAPDVYYFPQAGNFYFLPPEADVNHAPDIKQGRYMFLNEPRTCGFPPQWDCVNETFHWQLHLHYLDYIWSLPYEDGRILVLDWINHNPLRRSHAGWDAYAISMRLTNICGYFIGRYGKETLGDRELCETLWKSVYLQAEWLRRHMEYHVGGNHLLENALALLTSAVCWPVSPVCGLWIKTASRILKKEIPRQILGDGMHISRTPMYHARMVYVVLALYTVAQEDLRDMLRGYIPGMLRAMRACCHSDGKISLLNDAVFGNFNQPADLLVWAEKLGVIQRADEPLPCGPIALECAGIYGFRSANGDSFLCDTGPVRKQAIPGHGHAGTFTFELSWAGVRMLVDSGGGTYEDNALRSYCRATRAHNTVEINSENQTEFWGTFRTGRVALTTRRAVDTSPDRIGIAAAHSGYMRFPERSTHERSFLFVENKGLFIRDRIRAKRPVSIKSRMHLAPSATVEECGKQEFSVSAGGVNLRVSFRGDGVAAVEDSLYCPEFGLSLPNKAIVYEATGSAIDVCTMITAGSARADADAEAGVTLDGVQCGWPCSG